MSNNFSKAFSPLNKKLNIRVKKAMAEVMKIIGIELEVINTRPSIRKMTTVKIPNFQCFGHIRADDIPSSPIIVKGQPIAHLPN